MVSRGPIKHARLPALLPCFRLALEAGGCGGSARSTYVTAEIRKKAAGLRGTGGGRGLRDDKKMAREDKFLSLHPLPSCHGLAAAG